MCRVMTGILKLGIETLQLLAGGTLAMQATILAASLFQKMPDSGDQPPKEKPQSRQRKQQALPSRSPGEQASQEQESSRPTEEVQIFRFTDPQVSRSSINQTRPAFLPVVFNSEKSEGSDLHQACYERLQGTLQLVSVVLASGQTMCTRNARAKGLRLLKMLAPPFFWDWLFYACPQLPGYRDLISEQSRLLLIL